MGTAITSTNYELQSALRENDVLREFAARNYNQNNAGTRKFLYIAKKVENLREANNYMFVAYMSLLFPLAYIMFFNKSAIEMSANVIFQIIFFLLFAIYPFVVLFLEKLVFNEISYISVLWMQSPTTKEVESRISATAYMWMLINKIITGIADTFKYVYSKILFF